jgi:LuxR family transcriptional regulator, maltose regulon positive regulatory protein
MADGTIPLLETKLHAPRRRRRTLARPRLRDRLERGEQPALTVVSAAAGFGKTTLVAEWIADRPGTAWVSLDQRDNDPILFWSYVIAALETVAPEVGEQSLLALRSTQPSIDVVVTMLINDLYAVAHEITLVLDDYHVIENRPIHDAMTMLVEHLPAPVKVVLVTRSDPPLPLARLRARGDLGELRAADLRFTAEEAASYLNDTMELALTPADVDALDGRTEGWIAALQLAALSMQGHENPSEFIAEFAGDDRFILDYLAGEVLDRQPREIRDFLLRTSILSRMTGSLCEAVTGQTGGRATLEHLDRANLFLVPLDERRTWYRYHHLFGDVLQARLLDEEPDRVAPLHLRASDWHEERGDRPEAIRHALAGRDFERAAELVELAGPDMRRTRREAALRDWYEALPRHLFPSRPVLSVGYVGAIMASGRPGAVVELLDQIDRCLDAATAPAEIIVVDEVGFATLPAQVAIYRAAVAHVAGDATDTIAHAERALRLMAPDDHLHQGSAAALVGLAQWAEGDLRAAEVRYLEAIGHLERAGHVPDVLGCSLALGDIQSAQGRLGDALTTLETGLRLAEPHGALRGTADLHIGLAEVLLERDDLDGAAAHLQASSDLGAHATLGQHAYRSRVALARLLHATGETDGVYDLLSEAERLYDTDFSPPIRPVAATTARLRLADGDLKAALRWVRESAVRPDDDLIYIRQFEHLTLARVLLADGDVEEATELLDRLVMAAEAGRRTGAMAEGVALRALAHEHRGDLRAAIHDLEHALLIAEPEDHRRIFLDEGSPMVKLLGAVEANSAARGHAVRILRGFTTRDRPARRDTGLVVDLSARELEVLRLLRSDLSGPDIAAELLVSLNTFRTHTKNIFSKLGVNNRREAVTRGNELGL